MLKRHFLPVLGRKSLSDIVPLDIAEITDDLVDTPPMARSALVFGKAMLHWCVRRATYKASVPPHLVQRWLGHASLRTTTIYGDVLGPEERALAARMWMRPHQ